MKLYNLKQIYDEVTGRVISTENEWRKFLSFYSGIYKYSFESALMIYAQRPDATLVADMETWNRKVGRWINKGARSIKIFDSDGKDTNFPKTKYLFDIKDTNGSLESVPKLWAFNNSTSKLVSSKLKHYTSEHELPLEILLGVMSELKVNSAFDEIMLDFKDDLRGNSLEELPYEGIEVCFKQSMINSVTYMVGKRCGINTDRLNDYDLSAIRHFNTKLLITRLGCGLTRISHEILKEIESTVRQLINEKRSHYRKRWEEKKAVYKKHDIIEGENLIVCYNNVNGSIDSVAIKALVEKYLL